MKRIFYVIIFTLLIAFFFPKEYVISPGYTTEEFAKNWSLTKKTCLGFIKIKSNFSCKNGVCSSIADSPEEALCFGWLK